MKAMPKLVHVTAVEVVGDHRLRLSFEDGADGVVDLSEWEWRGVFEPVADPDYFREVELDPELGTIVWPNGADIAPETLHSWVTVRLEHRSGVAEAQIARCGLRNVPRRSTRRIPAH